MTPVWKYFVWIALIIQNNFFKNLSGNGWWLPISKLWFNHYFMYILCNIHVTVRPDKYLILKPTRCTNFSNLFLEWNSTCFGQFLFPSSGVFRCTHNNGICCQQTCMTYNFAVCTVKISWWWTEELYETCRVSFQKWIWENSASSWFYYKKIYGLATLVIILEWIHMEGKL